MTGEVVAYEIAVRTTHNPPLLLGKKISVLNITEKFGDRQEISTIVEVVFPAAIARSAFIRKGHEQGELRLTSLGVAS
ncbi:MAG: hypothetical protein AAGG51_07980 [Cyanobacteria bacterium P01_G01_bin.54]